MISSAQQRKTLRRAAKRLDQAAQQDFDSNVHRWGEHEGKVMDLDARKFIKEHRALAKALRDMANNDK